MEELEASSEEEKPWVRLAGGLKHLHKETQRINQIIRAEFEQIDPADCSVPPGTGQNRRCE
jgi:hypothetical protein